MNSKQVLLIIVASSSLSVLTNQLIGSGVKETLKNPTEDTSAGKVDDLLATIQEQSTQVEELKNELALLKMGLASTDSNSRATISTQVVEVQASSDEASEEPQNQPERPVVSANDIRKQRLVSGGFGIDEANWILQNEQDVQLDSLYEQHRARRAQVELASTNGTRAKSQQEQLRERLGDDYYERYLSANGFPTSVGVSSVLNGSPGSDAGLQAGDQILSYGGERVFNIRDLNGLTVLGNPGETVLIEVERDGSPVQLSLPRGPIGITGGRRRRF